MSDEGFSLALTTAVLPAKKFTVDGAEYEMLGTDHLSPDDEAQVLALFARHNILTMELDRERNPVKGKVIAERQRTARMAVIGKLTTLPPDVAGILPLSQQVKLLEAIREEVEQDDEDEEAVDPIAEAAGIVAEEF